MLSGRIWIGRVALLSILLAGLGGCGGEGGDAGPSGPGDGAIKNPVAAAFASVAAAMDGAIAQNLDVYASLEYFGPRILATVAARKALSTYDAGLQSCIPAGLQGKLFSYDNATEAYVGTLDASVPSGAVRYLLYQIGATGAPGAEIGYLQATCTGQLPADTLSVAVVANEIGVLDVKLIAFQITPPTFIFNASPITLRDANGDDVVSILAVADGTIGAYLNQTVEVVAGLQAFDSRLQGLHATIGRRDSLTAAATQEPPFDIIAAGVNQNFQGTSDWWRASVGMVVPDANGLVSNIFLGSRAPLEYEDQFGGENSNGVYACFSGHYADPLVEDASSDGGCASGVITTPLPLTSTELQAVSDGYVALLALLDAMTPMWSVGLALMVP